MKSLLNGIVAHTAKKPYFRCDQKPELSTCRFDVRDAKET